MNARTGIDWLDFNVPDGVGIEWVWLQLGMGTGVKLGHGKYGYKQADDVEGNMILTDGSKGMGTHVSMSSTGLHAYLRVNGVAQVPRLIEEVISVGGHVSRIDLAVDVCDARMSREVIEHDLVQGNVVTQARGYKLVAEKGFAVDAMYKGWTYYIGERSSDTMLRIYDKYAEQRGEGSDNWSKIACAAGQWVRFEYVFKGAQARKVGISVAEGKGLWLRARCGGVAYFVKSGPEPKYCRPATWYQDLITQGLEAVHGDVTKSARDASTVDRWVMQAASRNIAVAAYASGDPDEYLKCLLRRGTSRFKTEDVRLMAEAVEDGYTASRAVKPRVEEMIGEDN